jgi:hypothetical protein
MLELVLTLTYSITHQLLNYRLKVVDQVWLWDRELSRVIFTQVYQHQCLMPGEFRAVQRHASEIGAHAWSSDRRQQILINYDFVENMQDFCRQWRAKAAAKHAAA